MKKINKSVIVLIIIVLFGSFFRFLHIDYQLPELYLPDEEFFINPALNIANGHLNPGWFGAGQSIIYVIGFGFRVINFVIDLVSGGSQSFELNYQHHFNLFYTFARSLFAIFGSLTIIVVYFLTKFWNKRAALISAFLVASSFYLIDHSHIIRPDIPQTFFVLLFLLFLFKIIEQPKNTLWYILSGASLGVAFTTKYPALFFLPTAMGTITWLIVKKDFYIKKWITFGIASLVSAFVTGPFLFISFKATLTQIVLENRPSHGVHSGMGVGEKLWWYLSDTLQWEMGTFLYLLTVITVFVLILRMFRKKLSERETKLLIISITAFFYVLMLSLLSLHWERWAIPALTIMFIPSAVAIDYLCAKIKNKLLLSLIIALIFIGPGLRLVRTIYGYSNAHTIEQAKQWMLTNIPMQSKIVREPYTPELPENEYPITNIPNLGYDQSNSYYVDKKPFYFAISESVYGVILKRAEQNGEENFLGAIKNYEYLISNSELLYEIKPNSSYTTKELINSNDISIIKNFTYKLFIGPYIRIYKFNPSD